MELFFSRQLQPNPASKGLRTYRMWHERKDHRWLRHFKLRIIIVAFRRFDAEQSTIEVDGPAQVRHVEREMKAPRIHCNLLPPPYTKIDLRDGIGVDHAPAASTTSTGTDQ